MEPYHQQYEFSFKSLLDDFEHERVTLDEFVEKFYTIANSAAGRSRTQLGRKVKLASDALALHEAHAIALGELRRRIVSLNY